MLTVKRFAVGAISDREDIFAAAESCMMEYKKGNAVVAVLSAMEGQDAAALEKARELNGNPSQREIDLLRSVGAQMTAAFLAMALEALGMEAVSLHAHQNGIYTTPVYGNGAVTHIDTGRIEAELAQGRIVLVAGDYGTTPDGEVVAICGGGDEAARILAEALQADCCQQIAKMDKVYTAVA